jgi:hypothetical protein
MEIVQQLISELDNLKEGKKAVGELNTGYFITSILEDDYLYHTTYWERLKSILKDGFLCGNPLYLEGKGIKQKHPNMISFTTSKWRHLSDFPEMTSLLGAITHDCYLKIPFDVLKDKVKPVIYKLEVHEIEDMLKSGEAYYLSTITQNEQKLKAEYGDDYSSYLYSVWFVEQEWRMKADRYQLPPETEVYVSSYYQLKKAKDLTHLPVYIDKEIMQIKTALNFKRNIKNRVIRIIGKDMYQHGISQIEISTNPIRNPSNNAETKVHATLYDVKFLHGITIIKRLRKAGLTVWAYGHPWKYSPRADLFVDLTFLKKR